MVFTSAADYNVFLSCQWRPMIACAVINEKYCRNSCFAQRLVIPASEDTYMSKANVFYRCKFQFASLPSPHLLRDGIGKDVGKNLKKIITAKCIVL